MNDRQRWSGRWHVVNTQTRRSVESHETPGSAAKAALICNEHEERNDRPRIYRTEEHDQGWRGDAPRTITA